jgi:hypothetical protein
MRTHFLIAIVAAAALLGGSAFAQAAGDTAVNPPAANAPDVTPPSAPSDPGAAPSGAAPDTTAPAAGAPDASVAPAAQAPAERTSADSADDVDIVTNGPIPDTKANRAKYGAPLSSAGRMTRPTGD